MRLVDGAPITNVGATVSTLNVDDGPAAAALLPAKSDAVFAAMEIPIVPLPEIPEIVTVLEILPDPPTTTLDAAADPVVFKVTFPFASVTASAPA